MLADQKRHLPFASFCNNQTVSSACQDLQSRAAAHQRSNFPQKPVPEHVTTKISEKDLALHNHSTDFDSMFRSVGKKNLTNVASIYCATSCDPRLRAEHFWLVRLKLDQALVGWCWLVMPSAAQKLHSADGLQPICMVSNLFWKVSRRTHKCP